MQWEVRLCTTQKLKKETKKLLSSHLHTISHSSLLPRTNFHTGNKRYRKIVDDYKLEYCESKRARKMEIKEMVFDEVKPGRFLKKEDDGTYTEAPRSEALKKISQSLREYPLEQRKQNQITPELPNGQRQLLGNENRQELDYGNHFERINDLRSAHIRTNVDAEETLLPQDLFPTVSTDTNPIEEIASDSYDYAFTPEDIDILCDI